MARPIKEGLDYFPMDTDIEQNDKIALLEATYGSIALALILKILAKIYSVGYYYKWGEREELLFKRKIYKSDINVQDFINDCLKFEVFNEYLYRKYSVLTSIDIQLTYFEALKRRKTIKVIKEYLLLDEETINVYTNLSSSSINVDINDAIEMVNDNINTQSKVDDIKVDVKVKDKVNNSNLEGTIVEDNTTITCEEINVPKEIDLITNYYLNTIRNIKNCNDEDSISISDAYKKYGDEAFIIQVMELALEQNIMNKGRNTINSFNYFLPILEDKWHGNRKVQEVQNYERRDINSKNISIDTKRFGYGG